MSLEKSALILRRESGEKASFSGTILEAAVGVIFGVRP